MAHSEVNYIYDAANSFRAPGLPALTADAMTFLPLGKLTNVRPSSQRGKSGAQEYRIVIAVESLVMDDAEYMVRIVAQTDVGQSDFMSFPLYGTGQVVLIIDAQTFDKMIPNAINLGLGIEMVGTTTEIAFSAWMV